MLLNLKIKTEFLPWGVFIWQSNIYCILSSINLTMNLNPANCNLQSFVILIFWSWAYLRVCRMQLNIEMCKKLNLWNLSIGKCHADCQLCDLFGFLIPCYALSAFPFICDVIEAELVSLFFDMSFNGEYFKCGDIQLLNLIKCSMETWLLHCMASNRTSFARFELQ